MDDHDAALGKQVVDGAHVAAGAGVCVPAVDQTDVDLSPVPPQLGQQGSDVEARGLVCDRQTVREIGGAVVHQPPASRESRAVVRVVEIPGQPRAQLEVVLEAEPFGEDADNVGLRQRHAQSGALMPFSRKCLSEDSESV